MAPPTRASRGKQTHRFEITWSTPVPEHARPSVPGDFLDPDAKLDGQKTQETQFFEGYVRLRDIGFGSKSKGVSVLIGDTVLVRTLGKFPSVAVVTSIWRVQDMDAEDDDDDEDDEENIYVRVHWFVRPSEMPALRKAREFAPNEIYLSLAGTDLVNPADILNRCEVSGKQSNKPPRITKSRDPAAEGQEFMCLNAVDSARDAFYELDWDFHNKRAKTHSYWDSKDHWEVKKQKKASTPPPKKKQKLETVREESDGGESSGDDSAEDYNEGGKAQSVKESSDEEEPDTDEEERFVPRTPSKKQTRGTVSTPRRGTTSTPTKRTPVSTPRRNRVASSTTPKRTPRKKSAETPQTKAALRKRKNLVVRPPPPQLNSSLKNLPSDPWLRAMHVLHVGARPDILPCREEEYEKVLRSVNDLLEEGSGGCVYISGVPGTGKTATVHAVVRELKRMAEESETSPFTYVEINGLRIPEPAAAYGLLWEAVSNHDAVSDGHLKISSKESLKQLTKHFSGGAAKGPLGHACVVLMDELDQLVTAKQDVVYNFFNWPTLVGSKLVVLAVANTMDLPERVMTGRVRSRLGMTRINFQPYTTPQLAKIVSARLASAKIGLDEEGAAQDVMREDAIRLAAMKVSSISGDARRVLDICRRAVELAQPRSQTASVKDVNEVIAVMQNSPIAAYLRECSFHERLMLASLVKCVKREGVEEIKWAEVRHQHWVYLHILSGDDEPRRKPTEGELRTVLDGLLASRALLMEDAARKAEGDRRVLLNLEQGEVERVLSDVGGKHWQNVLSG